MRTIEESCYWLASRDKRNNGNSLLGKQEAKVAIIGAGFTGLWTAYFLKELDPECDIIIVEQGVAGYGGSGRNAGIISNCIDHSHALAIKHFGRKEAAKLAKIGLSNIDALESFAEGCDFERRDQLQIALTPAHLEDCQHNIEVAESLGIPGYKFLNQEEVQAELNSALYLGAALVPGCAVINPVKLVDKLKSLLEERGVRIYERSKVLHVEDGKITLAWAEIKAEKIVLATDSYTHHLFPQMLWRYTPLYDYVMVSEPLSSKRLALVGWERRQPVVDCRSFFNYYRLTADNRILWGTSEAKYYTNNKVDESCDHSVEHYKSLHESFIKHFPQLKDLRFEYKWGGPIASTTRLTPFFGSLDKDRIVYALGYTGHGIGSTRLAGQILAHMALAKASELLALEMVQKKPFPYPPEPLRTASVNLVSDSLRSVDRGGSPNLLLRLLDLLNIGFSS